MQPETSPPVSGAFPPRPARVLPLEPADRPVWSCETCAVVVGAVFVSLLALLVWGTILWRYLQPSAFQGRLMLGPPLSVEFALFVLRPLAHAAVLAGAVVAWMGRPAARRLLLVGGLGAVALGLVFFVRTNLFPVSRSKGADVVFYVVDGGVRFVNSRIPHMLRVLAMTRPGARRGRIADAPPASLAPADDAPRSEGAGLFGAGPLRYSEH